MLLQDFEAVSVRLSNDSGSLKQRSAAGLTQNNERVNQKL